ncbi:hypothetical protein A3709_20805 [Halioglobus sp. HI00S01]|nr:hypothetical protein A3709_20805 [Halioglobus sp. HI00S01]
MDGKMSRYLARNPRALMQYQATRRLPRLADPKSPLIDLLAQISAADRTRVIGVRVGPDLGYRSGAQFQTAAQLWNWLKPHGDHESVASESHQDRRFQGPVTFEVFWEHCSHVPDYILKKYKDR